MLKELINQFQHLVDSFQKESSYSKKNQSFSTRMSHLASHYQLKNGKEVRLEIGSRRHIADILAIEKLGYEGKTPWGYVALEKDIVRSTKSLYLVLYHQFDPIAFLGSRLEINDIHVTNLAVTPEWQNQGAGRLLLDLLNYVAKEEQVASISLEVRVSNEKAKNLYKKAGFKIIGVKKNYYHGDGEDALDMRLDMEESPIR